jgi:hypothetical protein
VTVPVSKQQIPELTDEQLVLVATVESGTYADDIVLAAWEQLAARGTLVEFEDEQSLPAAADPQHLVTVQTFRNYVKAAFAQTMLRAGNIETFLFDDNTIRLNGLWSNALGGVKLRVGADDYDEASEILRLDIPCSPDPKSAVPTARQSSTAFRVCRFFCGLRGSRNLSGGSAGWPCCRWASYWQWRFCCTPKTEYSRLTRFECKCTVQVWDRVENERRSLVIEKRGSKSRTSQYPRLCAPCRPRARGAQADR